MNQDNRNRRGGSGDNRRGGGFNSGGRNGGGGRGGNRFGGGNRSGGNRFGGRDNFNRAPQQMHKAVCADCKKECEVPFKPKEDRPVYCRDCFSKHKKY
jgi:CxxC-x17-CxxC domain-containing protein